MNQTPSNHYPKPTSTTPSASKLTTMKPQTAATKTTPTRPIFTSSKPLSSAPRSTTPLSSARPVVKPTATTPTRPTTQFATRPQPTATTTPRTTAPRPTTKRTLTRNQIYVICGLVAALLLFMAFVIPFVVDETKHNTVFADEYRSTARHGYESEIIGTVKRNIPTQTYDEGLVANGTIPYYPTYGSTASYTTEQKTAVIKESEALTSSYTMNDVSGGHGGKYQYFDKDGFQRTIGGGYVDDEQGNHKKLYAHTAAKSMYYQGVKHVPYISDKEPAVIKRITFKPRSANAYNKGYSLTGLYAAPGELVTVKISGADLRAAGGQIAFFIGQCLYNGQSNNIWAQKGMNRMPNILNTLRVNKDTAEYDEKNDVYTAYLGSYLGGPIYLWRHTGTITMVIAGALEYRHFVLGYTTEKEYARLCKTTTPYFDLEVWDNGILHSGSVYYATKYAYDEIFDAAVLWEKITLVSNQVRQQGVVMVYDPFVAAGAAVAFPGRSSTNCPSGWMDSALNAAAFEKSGAWGNMHEYNHNFQGGWELSGGGEVSNNALNLASYLSFTKISSSRRLTTLNTDTGLGGWNAYTNASWALKNTISTWPNQLVVYATLLHGIGPKNFVSGIAKKGGLYKEMSVATGYNFDYYFDQIIHETVSAEAKTPYADRPAFVPVASIFQTGRSVIATNGKTEYIQTMQPYEFAYGENLKVDLRQYNADDAKNSGTIVVPNGITFDIVNVTQPEYGTLTKTATPGVYTYTPDAKQLLSGQIKVTLKLHADADKVGTHAASIEGQTVDLILEFKQSHEMNRTVLQRTVYKYDGSGNSDPIFNLYGNDPIKAFTDNFVGATSSSTADNKNTTENSNTDIWLTTDEYNNYGANSILVVSGKIYVPEGGSYRLTLRGRVNAGVALSLDGGTTYGQFIKLENKDGNADIKNTTLTKSLDLPNLTAGQWVYFKEILLMNEKAGNKKTALPFIGLGWGKVERSAIPKVDENGNAITDEKGNPLFTETEQVTLNYASAYRATYEFETKPYTSEYLFKREWKATYDPSVKYDNRGTLIEVKGFEPWYKKKGDNYGIANLFDDDNTNDIHSMSGAANDITPEHPFEIFVDLGARQDVNTMTIYGRNNSTRNYLPRNFTLYGGYSKNNLQVLATHTTDDPDWRVGNDLVVKFHPATIRYYRLVVHDTYAINNAVGSRYICFRYIQFDGIQDTLTNGTHLLPDDDAITYRGTWKVVNATSTFGRVYLGKAKDKVEFEFTGTRFGIYTGLQQSNGEFDVYIDGKRVAIANPKDGKRIDKYTAMGYLSDTLKAGTHTVKLVGRANFNIDSIVYW